MIPSSAEPRNLRQPHSAGALLAAAHRVTGVGGAGIPAGPTVGIVVAAYLIAGVEAVVAVHPAELVVAGAPAAPSNVC